MCLVREWWEFKKEISGTVSVRSWVDDYISDSYIEGVTEHQERRPPIENGPILMPAIAFLVQQGVGQMQLSHISDQNI